MASNFAKILTSGFSKEIGQYELHFVGSFSDFHRSVISASVRDFGRVP